MLLFAASLGAILISVSEDAWTLSLAAFIVLCDGGYSLGTFDFTQVCFSSFIVVNRVA